MASERFDQDALVEARLRASRPRPDPLFVSALEERLLPPTRSPRPRQRPLLAAAGAAAALAAAALAVGIAGGGPLSSDGEDEVRAKDDCRFVLVRKRVPTPEIVTGADGQPEIRYRKKPVTRRVKRCQ